MTRPEIEYPTTALTQYGSPQEQRYLRLVREGYGNDQIIAGHGHLYSSEDWCRHVSDAMEKGQNVYFGDPTAAQFQEQVGMAHDQRQRRESKIDFVGALIVFGVLCVLVVIRVATWA